MTAFSTSVFDDNIANFGPQLLIDGDWQRYASNKYTNWYSNANNQENQYMLVDLGANRDIGKIMIHNFAMDPKIANRIMGCQVQVFDNNLNFVWASDVINTGAGVYTYMYTPSTGNSTGSTGTPGV